MITNQLILNKMERITVLDLKDYLDEIGVEYTSKEKRASLYQKAVDSIKGDEDILRISKYVYLTSYDVREALDITRYRFNKMLDEGIISPDKIYNPNVYAGGRRAIGYLFYANYIINIIRSKNMTDTRGSEQQG